MIKVNEYFGGGVKSLGYASSEGNSTVGVMDEGEYEFSTGTAEVMVVIQGQLTVLLAGESDWKVYKNGELFHVPANSSFKVKSKGQTSYLCKY
jgi:uncharacterized protein YaiE (UPF0345 family)